eukprot:jgi/Chlat1/5548/Chrsp369S05346
MTLTECITGNKAVKDVKTKLKKNKSVAPPAPVVAVFEQYASDKRYMRASELLQFMRVEQRDIAANETTVQAVMEKWKSDVKSAMLNLAGKMHADTSQPPPTGLFWTVESFMRYLLDAEWNDPLKPVSGVTDDMTLPLYNYYIYASHNSYLTGNQLTSRSSSRPVVEALLAGCRIVELDLWEKGGKIKVLHGGTLTKAVAFEKCVKAVKDNAFVASPYPVVLNLENHLSPPMQAQCAQILRDILGDTLYSHGGDRTVEVLASPEALRGRIIISDKPSEPSVAEVKQAAKAAANQPAGPPQPDPLDAPIIAESEAAQRPQPAPGATHGEVHDTSKKPIPELDQLLYITCEKPRALETCLQLQGYECMMLNMSEPQLTKLLQLDAAGVVKYTAKHLIRVYPFGLRFDSSNLDPMLSWSHGIQVPALNTQSRGQPLWLARALFRKNGNCGLVKKPDCFLDGTALSGTLPVKTRLKINVLFGRGWNRAFDLLSKPDFYLKLKIFGVPQDSAKQKTSVVKSRQPVWNHQFEFTIAVPELALLLMEVYDYDSSDKNDFAGQFCAAVTDLRPGYRVFQLRDKKGQPTSATVLARVEVA